jgi:hypothetical protein
VSRLIQQNDNQDAKICPSDYLREVKPSLGLMVELGANNDDLCVVGLQNAK